MKRNTWIIILVLLGIIVASPLAAQTRYGSVDTTIPNRQKMLCAQLRFLPTVPLLQQLDMRNECEEGWVGLTDQTLPDILDPTSQPLSGIRVEVKLNMGQRVSQPKVRVTVKDDSGTYVPLQQVGGSQFWSGLLQTWVFCGQLRTTVKVDWETTPGPTGYKAEHQQLWPLTLPITCKGALKLFSPDMRVFGLTPTPNPGEQLASWLPGDGCYSNTNPCLSADGKEKVDLWLVTTFPSPVLVGDPQLLCPGPEWHPCGTDEGWAFAPPEPPDVNSLPRSYSCGDVIWIRVVHKLPHSYPSNALLILKTTNPGTSSTLLLNTYVIRLYAYEWPSG